MVGHDDDLMLRLGEKNCAAWKSALEENSDVLHDKLEPFQPFFKRLSGLFGE